MKAPLAARLDASLTIRPIRSRPVSLPDYNSLPTNPEKDRQRKLVLRHMLDFYPTQRDAPKILSLPGLSWSFEQQFYLAHPGVRLLAFELNRTIFERAIYHFPHSHYRNTRIIRCEWRCDAGHYSVIQNRNRTFLFNADVCDFLDGGLAPMSWRSPSRWNWVAKDINCVWLDSFSPIGSPFFERVLKSIGPNLAENSALCFSFVVGRDSGDLAKLIKIAPGDAVEARAEVVRLLLSRNGVEFTPANLHRYATSNENGSLTMGTVMGIARRTDMPDPSVPLAPITEDSKCSC